MNANIAGSEVRSSVCPSKALMWQEVHFVLLNRHSSQSARRLITFFTIANLDVPTKSFGAMNMVKTSTHLSTDARWEIGYQGCDALAEGWHVIGLVHQRSDSKILPLREIMLIT
jgi:hypothetical protein